MARILGLLGIGLTVVSLGAAVRINWRENPVRVGSDVLRVGVSVVALVVMSLAGGVAPPAALAAMAAVVGVVVGLALGWITLVRPVAAGVVARTLPVGLVVWGLGILITQISALAGVENGVEAGQTTAWLGVGLLGGTLLGRQPHVGAAVKQAGLAGTAAAMVALSMCGPFLLDDDHGQAAARTATDGEWVIVETVANPYGEQTDFVTCVDEFFYECPRFDGTWSFYTVTETGISSQHRWVDREVESYDVTIEVTFDQVPPASMSPGQVVPLGASGSASGSVSDQSHPREQFQWFVDVVPEGADRGSPVTLDGEDFLAVGIGNAPEGAPSSGSIEASFVVPEATEGARLVVSAGFWNCASCHVEWRYEAVVPDEDESGTALPPPGTESPGSGDPDTGGGTSDGIEPDGGGIGQEDGGGTTPPLVPDEDPVEIGAAGAIGAVAVGAIAAGAIAATSVTGAGTGWPTDAGTVIGGIMDGFIGGVFGPTLGGESPAPAAPPGPPGSGPGGTSGPSPPGPVAPSVPPVSGPPPSSAPPGGAPSPLPSGPPPGTPTRPTTIYVSGPEAEAILQGGIGSTVAIPGGDDPNTPRVEDHDQQWDENVWVEPRTRPDGTRIGGLVEDRPVGEFGTVREVGPIVRGSDGSISIAVEVDAWGTPTPTPPPPTPTPTPPPPTPTPTPPPPPTPTPPPPPTPTPPPPPTPTPTPPTPPPDPTGGGTGTGGADRFSDDEIWDAIDRGIDDVMDATGGEAGGGSGEGAGFSDAEVDRALDRGLDDLADLPDLGEPAPEPPGGGSGEGAGFSDADVDRALDRGLDDLADLPDLGEPAPEPPGSGNPGRPPDGRAEPTHERFDGGHDADTAGGNDPGIGTTG